MAVLEINNLNKFYKLGNKETFHALKDINVSFDKGELVSVIGESGSGKSTLMNLIGGLDSDFSGDIIVDGLNLRNLQDKQLDKYRKNKIGFVFQSFNLIPHLSILDNVTIALTLSNVKKAERIKRATEMLEKVGLISQINKKPSQLSGGQKQRVAIARALINDPEIILADEPTGALDSQTSKQILAIFKEIADDGKLVLMVTHSEKVASISSKVIELSDGALIGTSVNKEYKPNKKKKAVEIEPEETSGPIKKERQTLGLWSAVRLSFHNMMAHKTKNILMSIGFAIGIMSIILMLALGAGINNYINNTMTAYANPLVVEVNKPMRGISDLLYGVQFEQSEIDEVSAIEGVKSVHFGISLPFVLSQQDSFAIDPANSETKAKISIISSVTPMTTEDDVAEGSLPGTMEILLSTNAKTIFGNDVVGKTLKLEINYNGQLMQGDFKVSGLIKGSTSTISMGGGMGGGNGSATPSVQINVNYTDLKTMAENHGFGDQINPTTVYLVTETQAIAERVKAKALELGYTGSMNETLLGMFNQMSTIISTALLVIAGISLLVSAIMILVVLYLSVTERTKEIGVMKSIGARRKDIRRIFTAESFLVGVLSGTVGSTLALLFGLIINVGLKSAFGISVVGFQWTQFLIAYVISIGISMLSGLYPAAKAAKLDPVESLRHD